MSVMRIVHQKRTVPLMATTASVLRVVIQTCFRMKSDTKRAITQTVLKRLVSVHQVVRRSYSLIPSVMRYVLQRHAIGMRIVNEVLDVIYNFSLTTFAILNDM